MDGLFPPHAAIRTVIGEGALLLGGGRALLMQVAHPAVAQGVADHSTFDADPFSRLLRTLEASYTMVFGTAEQARRAAEQVRSVHERVTGPGYQANDPELLLWVHATLIDTALVVHRRFLRRLSPAEAAEVYQQAKVVAELFGCPAARQPASLDDFEGYVREMVAGLEVSDVGRRLAHSVLEARLPFPVGLARPAARMVTIGLLPAPLRDQFGFRWSPSRRAALHAAQAASRGVLPLVPAAIRRAPARLLTPAA